MGIMLSIRGSSPLSYYPIGRSDLGAIFARLDLDPEQIDRYLGPLEDIRTAVHNGLAHGMFGIETDKGPIGFYVIHPDRRDNACWWLGWFALDRRHQGRGYGRAAIEHVMGTLRRIDGCRRVRLFASFDNTHALRLYTQTGFQPAGIHTTGELVLEAVLPETIPVTVALVVLIRLLATLGHACHEGRLRSSAGPYPARVIGVERGPPAIAPM
jgi:diamine N-acetyltransferase